MAEQQWTDNDEVMSGLKDMGPVTFSGTWNEPPAPFPPANKRFTIVFSGRRFLWRTVALKRWVGQVTLESAVSAPEPGTVSLELRPSQPFVEVISPWWERTLFHIAILWAWIPWPASPTDDDNGYSTVDK